MSDCVCVLHTYSVSAYLWLAETEVMTVASCKLQYRCKSQCLFFFIWLIGGLKGTDILHSRSKGHMAKQTHSSSTKQVLLQWITTCFYHVSIIVKRDLWLLLAELRKISLGPIPATSAAAPTDSALCREFLALFVASFQLSLNFIYFRLIPSNSIYVTPSNLVPWCHTLSLRNSAEGLSGLQLFYPCFQRLANHSYHWRRNWLARHCISAWAFPFRCKFVYL